MAEPKPREQSDALVMAKGGGIERLREIMARLRAPDGCPWDREQDFGSIAPYTIEEAYEVADAIERDAMEELRGELGDLLLQVVYHAQMAEEAGAFTFDEVVEGISEKMVRRHPHVFGNESGEKSADQQTRDWEAIKAAERGGERVSVLDGIAANLPGLTRAVKLQNRAARVGFDWPETSQVLDKLQEEASELVAARETLSADAQEDEFGDLAFVMANIARHLKIDPERALRRTNAKFMRRFQGIEAALEGEGRKPEDASLEELDALWDAEKVRERDEESS